MPVSFATESFYSNNAFVFLNKDGVKQSGRYQILPVSGAQRLDAAVAKAKSPNFLFEELPTRLADASAKFRFCNSPRPATEPTIVRWCGRTTTRRWSWEPLHS